MCQFNIMRLMNEYGLSCVEDYTLYLLTQKNENWQLIFSESYMPFDEVVEYICHGQTYSYFSGVPRLHMTGEKLGLLKLSYINCEKFPFDVAKNNVLLIQVSNKFMEENFNKKTWRSDHYIMLRYKGENEFYYLNDIPPAAGYIKLEEIEEIYNGSAILINIYDKVAIDINKIILDLYMNIRIGRPKSNNNTEKITLEGLRDAIGITKVLIRRMQEFAKKLNLQWEIDDYYDYLSNCYIKTEYMRKKGFDDNYVSVLVEQIKEYDRNFKEKLTQALSCKIYSSI